MHLPNQPANEEYCSHIGKSPTQITRGRTMAKVTSRVPCCAHGSHFSCGASLREHGCLADCGSFSGSGCVGITHITAIICCPSFGRDGVRHSRHDVAIRHRDHATASESSIALIAGIRSTKPPAQPDEWCFIAGKVSTQFSCITMSSQLRQRSSRPENAYSDGTIHGPVAGSL